MNAARDLLGRIHYLKIMRNMVAFTATRVLSRHVVELVLTESVLGAVPLVWFDSSRTLPIQLIEQYACQRDQNPCNLPPRRFFAEYEC